MLTISRLISELCFPLFFLFIVVFIFYMLGCTFFASNADTNEGEKQGAASEANNCRANWVQEVSFEDLSRDDGGIILKAESCFAV